MDVANGVRGGPWKGRAYLRKKYPHAFPLSESQLKVLEELAKNAPTNPNKLNKKLKKAYSFVYDTLVELECRKIVSLRWEKSEKGRASRIYDLDLEGVLLVLYIWMRNSELAKRNHSLIVKTIEKHSSRLPLVFGKWQYLREAGLEDIALTRLKIMVDTHRSNPFRRGTGFYYWLEMEQQLTRFFFLFDFYRLDDNPIVGFDFKAWMNALKNDEEIRAYVTQELEYELRTLKNQQTIVEKVISFMQSPVENAKADT